MLEIREIAVYNIKENVYIRQKELGVLWHQLGGGCVWMSYTLLFVMTKRQIWRTR